MKMCSGCHESKPLVEFNKSKRPDGLQSYCRACQKNHYRTNAERYVIKAGERRRRITIEYRKIIEALKNRPCMDCGGKFPSYVMDFDHVSGEKEAAIAELWRTGCSESRLRREVEKCEVVCANCHRIRHHREGYLAPVSPLTSNQMKE